MAGRIFAAGQHPGLYASGTSRTEDTAKAEAERLRIARVPTGGNVAVEFPWIRRMFEEFAAGERNYFRRAQGIDKPFANNTPYPIDIHEVRFYVESLRGGQEAVETDLLCNMNISHRRQIVDRFMPIHGLQTEPDRILFGDLTRFAFKLPAPYYLQRSAVFSIDVLPDANMVALANTNNFWFLLHGYRVSDGEPMDILQEVDPEAAAANQWFTVSFQDGQQMPLQDMIVEHIGIGSDTLPNADEDLQDVQIRPQAPEGPQWHQGEFFPIATLAEQVGYWGAAQSVQVNPVVIHRPVSPYVLKPGELFQIEIYNQSTSTPYAVHAVLQGVQRGNHG